MKNAYEVRGDVTAIFLRRKDGTILETLIDTHDLSMVFGYPNSWYAHWSRSTKTFYVHGQLNKKTILLHRYLCSSKQELEVDHINHDTLDNRRSSNLRDVTHAQNKQNYKGANRNNPTGVRGVSWDKINKKYRTKIKINGIAHQFGNYDNVEEAERVIKEARAKLMPYSNEAS